jgi:hypothetical protein
MQITYDIRTQNTPTYFRIIKSDTNCSFEIDGKWLNRFHYTSTHQQNSVPRTILYCYLVDGLETNRSHNIFWTSHKLSHKWDNQSSLPQDGDPSQISPQDTWDLLWTKWQWARFPSKHFIFPPSIINPQIFHIHHPSYCDGQRAQKVTIQQKHILTHQKGNLKKFKNPAQKTK